MHIRRGLLALAIISPASFFAPSAGAQAFCQALRGGPGSDSCTRELVLTEIRLREASARLAAVQSAPRPRQCAAFRQHVRVMRASACIFSRCTTGHHGRENVAQMNASMADWQEIIARRCR
ncbi:MAG: hypothetical protein FD152_2511 [Xanthobacteraceae bacterium]|nr:MAG: hypothetical protein FD152_2511 [Xanthobacteraceae bacterium]